MPSASPRVNPTMAEASNQQEWAHHHTTEDFARFSVRSSNESPHQSYQHGTNYVNQGVGPYIGEGSGQAQYPFQHFPGYRDRSSLSPAAQLELITPQSVSTSMQKEAALNQKTRNGYLNMGDFHLGIGTLTMKIHNEKVSPY